MHSQVLWQKTLDILAQRLSKASYGMFVASLQPLDLTDNELTLQVPNEFTLKWVSDRHRPLIEAVLSEVAGHPVTVAMKAPEPVPRAEPAEQLRLQFPQEHKVEIPLASLRRPGLNPRWTFETLVVGPCNRFAHAAALSVAQFPGEIYNPLFLHGGVGLGKTHLMHAVGHHRRTQAPADRIVYLRAEKFTTEMALAFKEGRGLEFQGRYRQADLFLMDDIQFIGHKERTQEELFHIFNTLYDSGKQIVLSCDRPPHAIPSLEERLRSRFESGLLAEVTPPNMETRVAILQKKAALDGLQADDRVLEYIAASFPTNVRELEGAFIRVMAFASLQGEPLTVATAQWALKGVRQQGGSMEDILRAVAGHYGATEAELKSSKRTRKVAFARQVAMYLTRELTGHSLLHIGMLFGGRHYSTVHHACELIETQCRSQPAFQEEMERLIERIKRGP